MDCSTPCFRAARRRQAAEGPTAARTDPHLQSNRLGRRTDSTRITSLSIARLLKSRGIAKTQLAVVSKARRRSAVFNTAIEHENEASMNSIQRLPTVVIFMNGGLIEVTHSNCEARVVILDSDTEGGSTESIVQFNGTEFYLTNGSASEPSPEYVDEVLSELGQNCDAADMLIALTAAIRADGPTAVIEPIAQALATGAEVLGIALTSPGGLRGAQSVNSIVAAMETLVQAVGSVRLSAAASSAAGRAQDYLQARAHALESTGRDAGDVDDAE